MKTRTDHKIRSLALFVVLTSIVSISKANVPEGLQDLSSKTAAPSKSEQIREYAQTCFDRELQLWEDQRGRLPSDDEADFIIDTCANPKLK